MSEKQPKPWEKWLKRFGLAGFLFFFLKGMVWLFIFFGFGKLLGC